MASANENAVSDDAVEMKQENSKEGQETAAEDSLVNDKPSSPENEPEFKILPTGSKYGHPLLVSSDGFSYSVKAQLVKSTTWLCSHRSKKAKCTSTVKQVGDRFIMGKRPHIHPPDPEIELRAELRVAVKNAAQEDTGQTAMDVVETVLSSQVPEVQAMTRSSKMVLKRAISRQRSKANPEKRKRKPRHQLVKPDKSVSFKILPTGSKRGGPLLVSTDGYSYCVHVAKPDHTIWKCSLRSSKKRCGGRLKQVGEAFFLAGSSHTHQPDLGCPLKAELKAAVKSSAKEQLDRPACDILAETMSSTVPQLEGLTKKNSQRLKRIIYREKSKMRPPAIKRSREFVSGPVHESPPVQMNEPQVVHVTFDDGYQDGESSYNNTVALSVTVPPQEEPVEPVEFKVLPTGSKTGHPLLVASNGFSYCIKTKHKNSTMWTCSLRSKKIKCTARVKQMGDTFLRGITRHCHPADLGIPLKAEFRASVKDISNGNMSLSAMDIIKESLDCQDPEAKAFFTPMKENLKKAVNRHRVKMRRKLQQASEDNELNADFMPDDDYADSESRRLCENCATLLRCSNADSYCKDCRQYQCKECVQKHRTNQLAAIARHSIVSIDDMTPEPVTNLGSRGKVEHCSVHPAKQIEFYCQDHTALCCSTCAIVKHRNCDRLLDVTELGQGVKSGEQSADIVTLQIHLSDIVKALENHPTEIDSQADLIAQKMTYIHNKVVQLLVNQVSSKSQLPETEQSAGLEEPALSQKSLIAAIGNSCTMLESVLKQGDETQIFIAFYKFQNQLQEYKKQLKKL